MKISSISISNYKNLSAEKFNFSERINCLIGKNGVGKSNVLDSIYHLCFGKGFFNKNTSQNIQFGKDFFVIEGLFERNKKIYKINCSVKKGNKKIIKKNSKKYIKLSDHIGFLPLVIISPLDRDLIYEGSDFRRKFIDGIISQTNKKYLNFLINYNKVLAQRNALLKYFHLNKNFNLEALQSYNNQLEILGNPIFTERKKFIEIFTPIFNDKYRDISSSNEIVSIFYESSLKTETFIELLSKSLEKDKKTQYTNSGIHKDDLLFNINNNSIKRFGSQGQQKSFLIALKLAQFEYIKNKTNIPPILLLDDIFDKLDQNRVELIMQLIEKNNFGQIFISDTHYERTLSAIKTTDLSYEVFNLPT